MNEIVLKTILTEMFNAEYDLKIIANDTENNEITLFSGSPMYEYFITRYGEYNYIYSGLFGAVESFRISWQSFIARNQNNINRMYQALTAEYNPINNYEMTETESDETTNENTNTAIIDGTKTQTGTVTDSGAQSANTNIYGYDSAVAAPSDNVTGTNNNTRTDDLTYNDDTTTTTTDNGNTTHSRELSRSGNIGVTTSQQMIQSEIDLRKMDIATHFIYKFANEYLYTIGVCEL